MADILQPPKSDLESDHFLKGIRLQNFLSYGPNPGDIPLGRLNVFIGPNGVGKSNLIESIALLRSFPESIRSVNNSTQGLVGRGGGTEEWIWIGEPGGVATIEFAVHNPRSIRPLWHKLSFTSENQRFRVYDEFIEDGADPQEDSLLNIYYRYQMGSPALRSANGSHNLLDPKSVPVDASILARSNDPELYPELAYLSQQYSKIGIFREWHFGRNSSLRKAQSILGRSDVLDDDFSNLYLFLNHLYGRPKVKRELLRLLGDIYEGVNDIAFEIFSQYIRLFLIEGDYRVSCERLSDGTLRYLCLLAILLNPTPPPLICIEEPELGMHPDLLPKIADLLIEASTRTQLIVTTHSDIIVDAMTATPEAVIVCEKHDGQTKLNRLSADDLGEWLEKYRLGELWTKGELGGTRW